MRPQFNEGSDYDSAGPAGRSGRIILLGDGTEVLTDMGDEEMFDSADEDKDLESQVRRTTDADADVDADADEAGETNDAAETERRQQREGTPGPRAASSNANSADSASVSTSATSAPIAALTESPRVISASPLPTADSSPNSVSDTRRSS